MENQNNKHIIRFSTMAVFLIFVSGIINAELLLMIEAMLLLTQLRKIKINKGFLFALIIIVVHGIFNITNNNDTLELMLKQLIGIILSFIFYNTIINENNLSETIKVYLKFSLAVSIMCIVQQISKYIGISAIYDLRWLISKQLAPSPSLYRAPAIFTEPSACALVLLPAVYIGIYSLIGRNKDKLSGFAKKSSYILIIIGYIFTFSSVGYIGLLVSLILVWLEYKHSIKQIVVLCLCVFTFLSLYMKVSLFRERINDTLVAFGTGSNEIGGVNLSSQTLIINLKITWLNYRNTNMLGSGIGSHQIAYGRYIYHINTRGIKSFLNKEDANSLFLRIVSELGIVGFVVLFVFLIKNKCKEKNTLNYILNNMCITYFFVRLLRFGHYFNAGLWFFIVIYILTAKKRLHKEVKS